jgi:hypothetical protein
MWKANKFVLIEIPINSTIDKRFFLPNNDILRDKQVVGIETYRQGTGGIGATPQNKTLLLDEGIFKGYLTFMCDNQEVLSQVPLQKIAHTQDDKGIFPVSLIGITPTKSFIEFANMTNITTSMSIVLGVYYED